MPVLFIMELFSFFQFEFFDLFEKELFTSGTTVSNQSSLQIKRNVERDTSKKWQKGQEVLFSLYFSTVNKKIN